MRRLFVIIAILFAAECVTAQNPRAVLKSIEEGDVIKSTERFEKRLGISRIRCVVHRRSRYNPP